MSEAIALEGYIPVTGGRVLWLTPDGVDFNNLLSEWRWLVSKEYQPEIISALGDLFLRHNDGRIFWLDAGWGQLTEVAKEREFYNCPSSASILV